MISKLKRALPIVIILFSLVVSSGIISAQQVTTSKKGSNISIVVNSPKPPQVKTYKPGEEIFLQIDSAYRYCTNEDSVAQFAYSGIVKAGEGAKLGSYSTVLTTGASGGHGNKTGRWGRSRGPFVAPSEPGNYRIYFAVRTAEAPRKTVKFKKDKVYERTRRGTQVRGSITDLWGKSDYFRDASIHKGYIEFEVADENAGPGITCRAKNNPAPINGTVEFEAVISDSGTPFTVTWYEGADSSGSVLGTSNDSVSTIQKTYSQAGNYQVYAEVVDGDGKTSSCVAGVTVYDPLVDQDGDPNANTNANNGNGNNNGNGSGNGNGNGNSGTGSVDVSLDKSVTNTTCGLTWSGTGVTGCQLINIGDVTVEAVPTSGSRDIEPGRYRLQCVSTETGGVVLSNIVTCNSNPDLTES